LYQKGYKNKDISEFCNTSKYVWRPCPPFFHDFIVLFDTIS
jgi:hypothetical protein